MIDHLDLAAAAEVSHGGSQPVMSSIGRLGLSCGQQWNSGRHPPRPESGEIEFRAGRPFGPIALPDDLAAGASCTGAAVDL